MSEDGCDMHIRSLNGQNLYFNYIIISLVISNCVRLINSGIVLWLAEACGNSMLIQEFRNRWRILLLQTVERSE